MWFVFHLLYRIDQGDPDQNKWMFSDQNLSILWEIVFKILLNKLGIYFKTF